MPEVLEGEVVERGDGLDLEAGEIPPPPQAFDGDNLLPEAVQLWTAFWQSSNAQAVDLRADRLQLDELFQLHNQLIQWERVVAESPLVEGARKNVIRNPLSTLVAQYARRRDALADRFGINPLARFHLGIEAAEAVGALAAMRAQLDAAAGRAQPLEDED